MNKQANDILKQNIWYNNPVFIQMLGICSALAVTNSLINTFILAFSVTIVTAFSNMTISYIKSLIPKKVRMIVQTLVISFYVIIVDIIIRAYLPTISKALGPYVGLIITNCIIMGRAEAFAQSNEPLIAWWDGFTSGLGYSFILLSIAFVRELMGFGTFFGLQIVPSTWTTWTIMIMPPSAFFMMAIFIWIFKGIKKG